MKSPYSAVESITLTIYLNTSNVKKKIFQKIPAFWYIANSDIHRTRCFLHQDNMSLLFIRPYTPLLFKDWNHNLEVVSSDEKHLLSLMFVQPEGLLVYIKLS